jgi:general L-amino acid transport system substrate-binding protein
MLRKRILPPRHGFALRNLAVLFARLANFLGLLSAIRAFPAIGFQTLWDSVISLDLTGIIAFDAVREWEAARRLRCGDPGVAGWELRSRGKKDQDLPEGKTEKGLWVMKHIAIGILGAATLELMASAASAGTLDTVKQKGFIQCGVSTGLAGFSAPDDKGDWQGIDADFCRAVAAAVFGDGSKVKFTPLSAKERFTALQSGEVDILSRNTTWTINRDTALGLNFVGVTYYDGQGFMINAKKLPGVNSALQLSGAAVCVQSGTTTELNLADYFKSNKMEYNPVVFEKLEEVNAAYDAGRCDVYTTDQSGLYGIRLTLGSPADHVVLPEIISKEPLGPAVRQGDDQWYHIVKWTYFALLDAEEFGITKANVDEMKNSDNPEIKRVLGQEADTKIGTDLGVSNDWVVNIVKAVGNYGEMFERNVGSGSPLKIARGINALWTKGGLQYAPPIR